ncbi:MAG: hypothetical protein A2X04_12215 [Bacteroidetes bacterium GWF2_41_9]|nr:MAG: hypothetical protein A2X03_08765 [Bacteroidetes bacterium GWA2_40_15]OFX87066.1 MAG: hypothetical protein A2X06_03330 [Bacteroidetes bacterium GWC2_40_22]OFY56906.1 MAG: hypothetical protein A2X04_12215 [Bacteroidetes bacterium GWF2_41_9]HBH82639.1 hypothetical protein [Bacteroidales bacterium]
MKTRFLIFLILLSVLACKKDEEEPVEEEIIPDQLLGDTDAELLQSVFLSSIQATTTGERYSGSMTTYGFNLGRVENVSRSPIHSFMISRTNPDPIYYAYYSQRYPRTMPYGNDLTLKAHIKGVDLEGEGISLIIRCEDKSLAPVQVVTTEGSVSIKGTFDWTAYTVELKDLQSTVDVLYVYLNYLPNTTGKVYFDDITLTRTE